MKKVTQSITAILIALLVVGCGGNGAGTGSGSNTNVAFRDVPLTTTQINALKAGDRAFAMVERESGIVFVPITLGNRYTAGANDYLTFKDSDAKFGFGDSGSPILTPDGHTIGALSGSYGGDNVLITPADKMLSAVGRQASASNQSFQTKLAWFGVGVSDRAVNEFKESNIHFIDAGPTSQAHAATRGGPGFELIAGRSMAVVPFDGPLVKMFAIGTLTHDLNKNESVGFGHPLNWDGSPFNGMPVSPARVVAFVRDPFWGSFKLAVPAGEFQGGIAQDRNTGILVERTRETQWINLVVNANGRSTTHRVCRLDDMNFQSLFVANGLDSVAQLMFDNGNPGWHETNITLTFANNETMTLEPGFYNWAFAGYDVWSAIADHWLHTVRVEITIN
jgi:hypothetical protein